LDVGDLGQGRFVPCIEENALIIREDEAKAWDSFGRWAFVESAELAVILFGKQKNIDSIHIDLIESQTVEGNSKPHERI